MDRAPIETGQQKPTNDAANRYFLRTEESLREVVEQGFIVTGNAKVAVRPPQSANLSSN